MPLATLLHQQEEAADDLIGVDYWEGQVQELMEVGEEGGDGEGRGRVVISRRINREEKQGGGDAC